MYGYDTNGRITSIGETSDNTLYFTESYTYDAEGNLTLHSETGAIRGEGRESAYVYDVLGRLAQESITVGDATTTRTYSHDGAGNLVREVCGDETTIYEYDNANRLKKKYLESAKQTDGTIIAGESHNYDRYGNLTSIINLRI